MVVNSEQQQQQQSAKLQLTFRAARCPSSISQVRHTVTHRTMTKDDAKLRTRAQLSRAFRFGEK